MIIITRIIETDTIAENDFVMFEKDGKTFAGLAKGFNDNGEIDVRVAALGLVSVPHSAVTDIM